MARIVTGPGEEACATDITVILAVSRCDIAGPRLVVAQGITGDCVAVFGCGVCVRVWCAVDVPVKCVADGVAVRVGGFFIYDAEKAANANGDVAPSALALCIAAPANNRTGRGGSAGV